VRPSVDRLLEVGAIHLMAQLGPALGQGYLQSSAGVLGALLLCAREEFERAAARRVEENAVLRDLFGQAAPVVTDEALRARLVEAAGGRDASLAISELERGNAALRGLLIDLHAHVEEIEGSGARRIEDAIWRELSASTVRRKLAIGPF
jgi:hypothetical protein